MIMGIQYVTHHVTDLNTAFETVVHSPEQYNIDHSYDEGTTLEIAMPETRGLSSVFRKLGIRGSGREFRVGEQMIHLVQNRDLFGPEISSLKMRFRKVDYEEEHRTGEERLKLHFLNVSAGLEIPVLYYYLVQRKTMSVDSALFLKENPIKGRRSMGLLTDNLQEILEKFGEDSFLRYGDGANAVTSESGKLRAALQFKVTGDLLVEFIQNLD